MVVVLVVLGLRALLGLDEPILGLTVRTVRPDREGLVALLDGALGRLGLRALLGLDEPILGLTVRTVRPDRLALGACRDGALGGLGCRRRVVDIASGCRVGVGGLPVRERGVHGDDGGRGRPVGVDDPGEGVVVDRREATVVLDQRVVDDRRECRVVDDGHADLGRFHHEGEGVGGGRLRHGGGLVDHRPGVLARPDGSRVGVGRVLTVQGRALDAVEAEGEGARTNGRVRNHARGGDADPDGDIVETFADALLLHGTCCGVGRWSDHGYDGHDCDADRGNEPRQPGVAGHVCSVPPSFSRRAVECWEASSSSREKSDCYRQRGCQEQSS